MSTLGNKTTGGFSTISKQSLTGDGGTSYTLQQSVNNENELEVYVNNTRQEPTTAYTAQGTTLTMTGAVNASDSFYVIFQGKAVVSQEGIFGNSSTRFTSDNVTIAGDLTLQGTGKLKVPAGTTAQSTATTNGEMRYNSTQNKFEFRQGGVTTFLDIKYDISYMSVAGGGGGGSSDGSSSVGAGGGGGAGGMIEGTISNQSQGNTISVVIGAGGNGQASGSSTAPVNGSNTTITDQTTTIGGGAGGYYSSSPAGKDGGSGGGAGYSNLNTGGNGTSGQGNAGGGMAGGGATPYYGNGGGGGKGAVGAQGTGSGGGNGGIGGTTTIITSSGATAQSVGEVNSGNVYFAGGGGGGSDGSGTQGTGGLGGGGDAGNPGQAGAANTGGGGGAGAHPAGAGNAYAGGNGGSGCVIFSVPTANYSSVTSGSPTVITEGDNTIIIFKSSGSYTT